MAVKFEVIIKELDDGNGVYVACTPYRSGDGATPRENDLGEWLRDTVEELFKDKCNATKSIDIH
ncbi:hypothetical protein HU47_24325 [Salmonella enterica subsp. enterica serovar Abaetetuba]|uniref:Uncharacterized protein n=1 Tax=Salmonella enterica TaxID=28901 RepID=A0A747H3W9_SALER|nr:hypothetical protein [Salmonella enterica]EBS6471487.1 hypothetical protein [Salmonella enterica subsp. enterica serovar Panama]EBV5807914.1 hypothetical protein [Salmonella enterica subsp. enterica serovar Abaetetuba]ECC2872431.1 hypothetical protein [Salmonella enterica subsp. enterica serovar Tanger]ECC9576500.1 hypothetical protein [Salmonella enterica subsp. houtenae]EDL1762262.1 hypothetical protein [Salmonella enterica subsp. enterica serovar Poona]EDQ2734746.1 hypothetical protein 